MSAKDWWRDNWIAVLALTVSLITALFVGLEYRQGGRALKTHLDPELVCVLDDHPKKEHFLLFSIKNEGSLAASTVSVDHYTLRYRKQEGRIRFGGAGGETFLYNAPGVRWLYLSELVPNAVVSKLTGEFARRDAQEAIDVLVFEVSFLRDTDGRQYGKRCVYFVEGDRIYTRKTFRSHDLFDQVDDEVSRWMARKPTVIDSPHEQLKQ